MNIISTRGVQSKEKEYNIKEVRASSRKKEKKHIAHANIEKYQQWTAWITTAIHNVSTVNGLEN